MTATETNIVRKSTLVKKLAPKNWNPKSLLGEKEEVRSKYLGRLVGIAREISIVEMPSGELFKGLRGSFKFTPSNVEEDILASNILYLPSGISELFLEALEEVGEDTKAQIEIAIDISVLRANNPAGYEWAFRPLIENVRAYDPIAALEAKVADKPAALPAPSAAPKATTANNKAKAPAGE